METSGSPSCWKCRGSAQPRRKKQGMAQPCGQPKGAAASVHFLRFYRFTTFRLYRTTKVCNCIWFPCLFKVLIFIILGSSSCPFTKPKKGSMCDSDHGQNQNPPAHFVILQKKVFVGKPYYPAVCQVHDSFCGQTLNPITLQFFSFTFPSVNKP